MSESGMWGRVRRAFLKNDPVRIENRIEKGTPDVNLAGGEWIELKWKRRKPKNPNKIFQLDHEFTQEQRVWHIRRHHAGGKTFVLIKVGSDWILLAGNVAAEYLERVSYTELKLKAIKIWYKKLVDAELRQLLTEK
jgi:hypothetical protein